MRTLVKGREIDLVPYYACPRCGFGEDSLIQMLVAPADPVLCGLLVGDGVLAITSVGGRSFVWVGDNMCDVYLLREVGRVHCQDGGRFSIDHIFFDWRWKGVGCP